ncbi:hypothetical protein [Rhizobium sp. PAMB 3182]
MYGKAFTTIIAASIAIGGFLAMPAASFAEGTVITSGGQVTRNRTEYDGDTSSSQLGGKTTDESRGRMRCEISLAKEKAKRYGYRFPEVASVSKRAIVIGGRLNNRWRQIAFANHYGCPVLDR